MTLPQRMFCLACGLALCAMAWAPAAAQPARTAQEVLQQLVPTDGIPTNTVLAMDADGDSLWLSPLLNVTFDGGATFLGPSQDAFPPNTTGLCGPDNVALSLDVEGQGATPSLVWAGLAFSDGAQAGAGGFAFSTDGGQTFACRAAPLDSPDNRSVTYGVSTLDAAPVTQEIGSAPRAIDADPATGTVWVAGEESGLRQSTNGGDSWQRVVLPPDTLDAIFPDTSYRFFVGPPEQNQGWLNHFAQSVLVDETGTVWAGTAAGVNRSRPEDVQPNGRIWRRFSFDSSPDGLVGDFVSAIEEQPLAGQRNPIWIASLAVNQQNQPRQNNGLTVTRDGGDTFEQVLVGERVNGIAFGNGRVYAATNRGLFISANAGRTWTSVSAFELASDDAFIKPDVQALAVATTPAAVWVSTTDGLLRRAFGAERWTLFRADVPVNPETPTERVPDVATYAYPNPFSPVDDRVVRIRYELDAATDVEVRIFDFSMNLVRRIVDPGRPPGEQETTWNGKDAEGLRVANGPYFYVVDIGDETVRGKILVLR